MGEGMGVAHKLESRQLPEPRGRDRLFFLVIVQSIRIFLKEGKGVSGDLLSIWGNNSSLTYDFPRQKPAVTQVKLASLVLRMS